MVAKLKIERIKKGLTQQKLADLTSLKQITISQIEFGRKPLPDERAVLAAVLEIPVDELFPD